MVIHLERLKWRRVPQGHAPPLSSKNHAKFRTFADTYFRRFLCSSDFNLYKKRACKNVILVQRVIVALFSYRWSVRIAEEILGT
jgi:hypothetical protein